METACAEFPPAQPCLPRRHPSTRLVPSMPSSCPSPIPSPRPFGTAPRPRTRTPLEATLLHPPDSLPVRPLPQPRGPPSASSMAPLPRGPPPPPRDSTGRAPFSPRNEARTPHAPRGVILPSFLPWGLFRSERTPQSTHGHTHTHKNRRTPWTCGSDGQTQGDQPA